MTVDDWRSAEMVSGKQRLHVGPLVEGWAVIAEHDSIVHGYLRRARSRGSKAARQVTRLQRLSSPTARASPLDEVTCTVAAWQAYAHAQYDTHDCLHRAAD